MATTTVFAPKISRQILEQINRFPNYLVVYYNALIAPGLFGLCITALLFVKHKNFRNRFYETPFRPETFTNELLSSIFLQITI
jgi:hypothetical protein